MENLALWMLGLQGYLLSCALDGTVKIWAPMENPQPNAILETAPNYSHPSTSENGQVRKLCTAACSSTCIMVGAVSWAKQTAHMYAAPLAHALSKPDFNHNQQGVRKAHYFLLV